MQKGRSNVGEDSVSIPSALVRRASNVELPFAALPAIQELRRLLDGFEGAAIQYARERGASWDELAETVGTSRQALQHRMRVRESNGK